MAEVIDVEVFKKRRKELEVRVEVAKQEKKEALKRRVKTLFTLRDEEARICKLLNEARSSHEHFQRYKDSPGFGEDDRSYLEELAKLITELEAQLVSARSQKEFIEEDEEVQKELKIVTHLHNARESFTERLTNIANELVCLADKQVELDIFMEQSAVQKVEKTNLLRCDVRDKVPWPSELHAVTAEGLCMETQKMYRSGMDIGSIITGSGKGYMKQVRGVKKTMGFWRWYFFGKSRRAVRKVLTLEPRFVLYDEFVKDQEEHVQVFLGEIQNRLTVATQSFKEELLQAVYLDTSLRSMGSEEGFSQDVVTKELTFIVEGIAHITRYVVNTERQVIQGTYNNWDKAIEYNRKLRYLRDLYLQLLADAQQG